MDLAIATNAVSIKIMYAIFSVFASLLCQSKQPDHHYTEGWCQLITEISVAVKTLYNMYNCHLNTNCLHIIDKNRKKRKKKERKKREKKKKNKDGKKKQEKKKKERK